MSRLLGCALMAAVSLLAARGAAAQAASGAQPRSRDCDLQLIGTQVPGAPPTQFVSFPTAAGNRNDFVGGGVNARCTNTDQRLTSDSLEHFGDQRLVFLIGRVHYAESRVDLTADRMTYHLAEEKLIAEGNVIGRTNTGTRFSGPRAVYLRAKTGVRDRSRLDAGGRPNMWISARDAGSDTTAKDSTNVVADSVISDNDSLVYARGKVVIERKDLSATSDSAMIDQGNERAALRHDPKVVGKGERPFTLTGVEIDIQSRNRQAERVRSSGKGSATSDDMSIKADSIDLRVANQKLTRAVAWGPGRASAVQPGREVLADSIDVRMPNERMESMYAVRGARVESAPDSTKVRSKERDWFAGDTIKAEFDTLARSDTGSKAAIKRLLATGNAKSWQQTARDGAAAPDSTPAINYMGGRVIDVTFNPDRSLQRVRVMEQAFGVLVQPAADTARKAAPPRTTPPGTRSRP
jgi:lipopolysaccharide export system protein LptA